MQSTLFLIPSIFLILLLFPSLIIAAEVTKLYPVEDGVTLLYDGEQQDDWASARNYQGAFSRAPEMNTENLAVRSDSQSGFYRIYRTSLVFDTSILPDNALIESVAMYLYKYPFANNHAETDLVLTSHARNVNQPLRQEDWYLQNFTTEFSRGLLQDGQLTKYIFNNDGLNYVNLADRTAIGVMTEFDFDDITQGSSPTGGSFYAMESTDENLRPYLEITYTVLQTEKTLSEYVMELETYIASLVDKSVRNSYMAHVKKVIGLHEVGSYTEALEQIAALDKKIERDGARGEISEEQLVRLRLVVAEIRVILEENSLE